MKKLFITLLCMAALPLWAAEDKTLAFYQHQALMQASRSKQDRAFATALARDVNTWIRLNPNSGDMKTAILFKAELYQRAQQYANALLALYQVRFYFPADQDIALLSSSVENMVEELNHNQKAQALKLLAVNTAAINTLSDKQAILLEGLVQADLEGLYEPVCELFENFFVQYPAFKQLDKMTLLYGDWHRQNGNFYAAIVEYKKVNELMADTPYKAASLRMTADIYAMDLKDYDTASTLYNQVLTKYPDSAERGIVYKHLAIMEENRKDYPAALSYYQKAIEDLGNQPAAYEAWTGKADVSVKTKQYQQAYDTLMNGAAQFSAAEKPCVDMLQQAAEIARRRLKDPAKQVAALDKIIMLFPQNHQAPQVMYELAAAYEKLEKTQSAVQLYKQLVINYPTDKYAARAQSRLNKLEK